MIVLVGFMGAGKSTVGRLLAERIGLPFVDTDSVVEERAGASVATIFEEAGEAAFRAIERDVIADVLAGPEAVVALGGGALGDPATSVALESRRVVYLEVDFEEAMRRVDADDARPMLKHPDVGSLYDERRESYERAAAATVGTDGRSPEQVVDELLATLEKGSPTPTTRVKVDLGDRSYDVVVGRGVAKDLESFLPVLEDCERALVVTHASVAGLVAGTVDSLRSLGLEVHVEPIAEGERAKALSTVETLYTRMAELMFHRRDLIVSFGGGVVCDVVGFVASTFNRGLRLAHVPTTLLAQVDAAIGGKTAINLSAGKNLVGTVYQPAVVVCDVDLLASLPIQELRSGLAEVVKYGLISDPELLEFLLKRKSDIEALDREALAEIVARSVEIKARIVARDETELGDRAWLNYGHTFGHAIEHLTGMRHGEAIALGMMCAAHLARELGRVGDDVVDAHRRVLEAVGLPTRADLDLDALERVWLRDKKYRGAVRFVLLADVGVPEAGVEVDDGALHRAIERVNEGR